MFVGQSDRGLPSSLFHLRVPAKSTHVRHQALALSFVADLEWASLPRGLLPGEVAQVALVGVEARCSQEDHAKMAQQLIPFYKELLNR